MVVDVLLRPLQALDQECQKLRQTLKDLEVQIKAVRREKGRAEPPFRIPRDLLVYLGA